MPLDSKYSLAAVELDTTVLSGITRHSVGTDTQTVSDITDGELFARWLSIMAQDPKARFTTQHISAALTNIGLLGTSINDLSSGLKFYSQKHQHGGSRASGSVHRVLTFIDGIIVPRQLTVEHQGNAEIEYEALITWEGSTDPIQISDTAALPTISSIGKQTLGPITIAEVDFDHIKRLTIDFGVVTEQESADSDIWPRHVSIKSIKPVARIEGIDAKWFSATKIPLLGQGCSHANTTAYLRDRAQHGTYAANDSTTHTSMTMSGLAYGEEVLSASGEEVESVTLVLEMDYDGTNLPIVIDTTADIV